MFVEELVRGAQMIIEDLLRNPLHLMMLFLVATMIFGTSKIAEAGKHLGRGIKEFNREIRPEDPPPAATSPSAVPRSEAKACASCGELVPAGARFCLSCGHAVAKSSAASECPTCHATLAAGARFCNACGTPVSLAAAAPGA